jgi:hypothetical protein
MKRYLLVAGLFVLAHPAAAQTVTDSDMTYTVTLPDGEEIGESTTLIPYHVGACYNWHLRLGKTKGAIAITEVYTLPSKPKSWGLGEGEAIEVSEDRLSATSELLITPEDGWISNGWCITRGDPKGDYSFEIFAGDTPLHRFEFELQALDL